jgi:hypothetical protein
VRSRFAVLFLAVGALSASAVAATAAPHHNKGLTIAATPNPIVAGTGVEIYGALTGTTVADQPIKLWHKIAGAKKFTVVSTTTTSPDGVYTFTRAEGKVLTNRDWYVTGPDKTHSRTIEEKVQAVLNLVESGSNTVTGDKVVFTGTISPDHAHQIVRLQEQGSIYGATWHTIATTKSTSLSTFTITKRFSVPNNYTLRAEIGSDARNVASASDSVTLNVQQKQIAGFTLNTSAPIIPEGSSADLSGVVAAATSTPTAVELYSSTAGGKFKKVVGTTTGLGGSYSFDVSPVHNTVYQVRSATAHSAKLYEGVADVISDEYSTTSPALGTAFTVTGKVSPSKVGHWIYLQELRPSGAWTTIVGGKVASGSEFSLSYAFGQAGTYTVRVRIFGGPENVGGASPATVVTVPAA